MGSFNDVRVTSAMSEAQRIEALKAHIEKATPRPAANAAATTSETGVSS
jgi:hypothetical protein